MRESRHFSQHPSLWSGSAVPLSGKKRRVLRHRPECLPTMLRSWNWLPEWMRSLEPADQLIVAAVALVRRTCCQCRTAKKSSTDNAAAQSAASDDVVDGRRQRDGGSQATTTTACLLAGIPLLKHGDGESGYASVATTPAPSRFPSNAFMHIAEDDDGQSSSH